MPKPKPPLWKDDLIAAIKEGKTYAEVVEELTEKYGEEDGSVGASTYGKLKKQAFPTEKVDEVLGKVREEREKKKRQGKVFPPWTPQKQAAGDKSQLADVFNQIIFLGIPCPGGELKLEDIKTINVGGGIVNTVQYVFPQIDLGNPILVLTLRVGLLFVKVKKLCYDVKRKLRTGVKPEYQGEPVQPEQQPQTMAGISEHPTDKYWREHGLFELDEVKKQK